MPFDPYSLCPGGTGKKIKFCCGDLVGDLQKIDRMIEGEQYVGCLQHIEQLEQKHPDRACLLAIKAMLLRVTGKQDEAGATVARFLEKHPQNTTAMAESAILRAIEGDGQTAIGLVQRALSACDQGIPGRLYEAIGVVAEVLLDAGDWLPARAFLQLQIAIADDDQRPVGRLVEFNRSPSIPTLFKDDPAMSPCPDDAPWTAQFVETLEPMRSGNWQLAAERMTALAGEVDDAPAVWQNLATLRGWLGDRAGCIEALQKYASLEVPLEDAVEAEALSLLLSDDPLGDRRDVLLLGRTIHDFEQVQAALTLEKRAAALPIDLSSLGSEESPPPKAAYMLLDRPVPETAKDLTMESMPRVLGQAMVYGRQTDREARLEVIGVVSMDREEVEGLLTEMAGGALGADVEKKAIGEVSASQELLRRKWHPPRDVTGEQLEALAAEHQRDAVLGRWPDLKLTIFDDKSARELAGDPSRRVRLLAVVLLLEMHVDGDLDGFDCNALRRQLELPTLEPIDPQQTPIAAVPLTRLSRVMVEKTSDEALCEGFRRTMAFAVTSALHKFSMAVVERPGLAGGEDQLRAYSVLARSEKDPDRALAYIDAGRKAAQAAGQSCAPWDLMELRPRLARREGEDLARLVEHLRNRHLEEPGVAEALSAFLVQVGAIHPDGTPAAAPPVAAPMAGEPPMPAAAETSAGPAAEDGKIWTPESEQPGGQKKLWTPD